MENDSRSDKMRAYGLAREAAKVDFQSALQGLLAGHQEAIEEIREEYTKKDIAFLMALSLTEKGRRLDPSGIMQEKIAEGLRGRSLSEVERRFLENRNA